MVQASDGEDEGSVRRHQLLMKEGIKRKNTADVLDSLASTFAQRRRDVEDKMTSNQLVEKYPAFGSSMAHAALRQEFQDIHGRTLDVLSLFSVDEQLEKLKKKSPFVSFLYLIF